MTGRSDLPTKTCVVCGRTITWRKKWARGDAEITQAGRVVDPSTAKGPIRVRPTSPG